MRIATIRIRNLLMLVPVLAAAACGSKSSSDDVQETRETAVEDLMIVGMEDSACGASAAVPTLSKVSVWLWDGSAAAQSEVSLSANSGSDGELISSGVLGAVRDLYTVTECVQDGNDADCSDKSTTVTEPILVPFCRSSASYARESVESIVLTSQYLVGKARDLYRTLSSKKDGLLDAALLVQPRLIKNVKLDDGSYVRLAESDNAGFTFSKEDGKYLGVFVVFPTSKSQFQESPMHLWESPFVMTHEYGHNVFFNHVGEAAASVGLKLDTMPGLDHIVPRRYAGRLPDDTGKNKATVTSKELAPRNLLFADQTPAQKALGGCNELFADLFAFYSAGGVTGQLNGIPFLVKSRDPVSAVTADGNQKNWTATAQSVFEGKTTPSKTTTDGEPNFDGVHDVAAVLSYGVTQMIDAALPSADKTTKLNVLLKWADSLASYTSSAGSSATLDQMIKRLVTVILENKTVAASSVTGICSTFTGHIAGLPASMAACQ